MTIYHHGEEVTAKQKAREMILQAISGRMLNLLSEEEIREDSAGDKNLTDEEINSTKVELEYQLKKLESAILNESGQNAHSKAVSTALRYAYGLTTTTQQTLLFLEKLRSLGIWLARF